MWTKCRWSIISIVAPQCQGPRLLVLSCSPTLEMFYLRVIRWSWHALHYIAHLARKKGGRQTENGQICTSQVWSLKKKKTFLQDSHH